MLEGVSRRLAQERRPSLLFCCPRRANPLGAVALEHALLAVDPHGQRLMPVDALEMTSFDQKNPPQWAASL